MKRHTVVRCALVPPVPPAWEKLPCECKILSLNFWSLLHEARELDSLSLESLDSGGQVKHVPKVVRQPRRQQREVAD